VAEVSGQFSESSKDNRKLQKFYQPPESVYVFAKAAELKSLRGGLVQRRRSRK
jgi:hypothetical protein